jgi:abortive infection alpha-like protein
MDEDKQIIEAAKALGFDKLIPELYRDMLQPAAQQLGDGLATVAKTVKISLAPLEAGIWGYEQIKDWLSIRVTRILADRRAKNIQSPPLSIAGPLVLQMAFAKDEPDLKELYASLLASAMDPNQISAHPSFVSIIQQLTPDEAKILRHVAQIDKDESLYLSERTKGEGGAIESVKTQFKKWCEQAGVTHLNKSDAYMDNLVRLRILNQIMTGGDTKFDPYDSDDAFPWSEYASVELTSFGRLFLDACIEKDTSDSKEELWHGDMTNG